MGVSKKKKPISHFKELGKQIGGLDKKFGSFTEGLALALPLVLMRIPNTSYRHGLPVSTTAGMQEVEQCMEQLPRTHGCDLSLAVPGFSAIAPASK